MLLPLLSRAVSDSSGAFSIKASATSSCTASTAMRNGVTPSSFAAPKSSLLLAPVEAPTALGAVLLADAKPNENGLGVPEEAAGVLAPPKLKLKLGAAVPSPGAPAALLPNAALAPVNVKEGDVGRESEGGMGRREGGREGDGERESVCLHAR